MTLEYYDGSFTAKNNRIVFGMTPSQNLSFKTPVTYKSFHIQKTIETYFE